MNYTQLKATAEFSDGSALTVTHGDYRPTDGAVSNFKSNLMNINSNEAGNFSVWRPSETSEGVFQKFSAGEIYTVDRTVIFAKTNELRNSALKGGVDDDFQN